MTDQRIERAFIVTVPKAGKNIIYSFLDKLDFSRFDLTKSLNRDLAMQGTYFNYFNDLDKRATWALPAVGDYELQKFPSVIETFLSSLENMPGGYYVSHHFAFDKILYEGLRKQQIPIVFLYRDPRDILLSMGNYYMVQGKPEHLSPKLNGLSLEEVLLLFLDGDEDLVPFSDYLASFNGWLNAEGVFALRFEDIIGPLGGGNAEKQYLSCKKLTDHIEWVGNVKQIKMSVSLTFNTQAGTFFKGEIGGWKEAFSDKILQLFNKKAGHLVPLWGYDPIPPEKNYTENDFQTLRMHVISLLKEHGRYFTQRIEQLSSQYIELKSKFAGIEEDSKNRLKLIHKHEAIISELGERHNKTEQERKANLKLLKKRNEDLMKLNDELSWTRAQSAKAEDESRLRLELIHKHEARIVELTALYDKTEQERKTNLELLKKRDENLMKLNDERQKAEQANKAKVSELGTLCTRAEQECRSFTELLRKQNEELSGTRAHSARVEEESRSRLNLIHKHEARIVELTALYDKTEQERKANLLLLKKRDEDLLELSKQIEYWRKEATTLRGIGRQLMNKIFRTAEKPY